MRADDTREQPAAHPDWELIPVDYPIIHPVRFERAGSVALSVRTPPGSGMYEDTAYLRLPNDTIVMMLPDESWADGPRPVAERTFVTADCARRREVDWAYPLVPWNGRAVKRLSTAAGDTVTICRGPGDSALAGPGDCYLVSSYLPAARLECGGGSACLGEGAATTVAEVCASVRRR